MPRSSAGVRSARWRKYGPQARTIFREMNVPSVLRDELSYLGVMTQREHIVALIESVYPRESEGHQIILKGFDVIWQEHADRRRHSGERERVHLMRTLLHAWILGGERDPNVLTTAETHDLGETFRKKWSLARLEREFNSTVARYDGYLTKPTPRELAKKLGKRRVSDRDVERFYYEVQLADAPREVIRVKGYDVIDNLLTLWVRSIKRMGRKIDDVVRWFLPLLRKHGLVELKRVILLILWEIRRKLRNNIAFPH